MIDYGKETDYSETWSSKLYTEEGEEGLAIVIGGMSITAGWADKNGNRLVLLINGENYECSIYIAYVGPGFQYKSQTDGL